MVTVRDDEPCRAEGLEDWLAATLRQPTAELVSLGPLADHDVDALASELTGRSAESESFLAAVRARAGGNPLFAEQLVFDAMTVTSEAAESPRVPDRVAALLDSRLAPASARERNVPDGLAVAQRPLDQDDLARVLEVAAGQVPIGGVATR